MFPCLVIHSSYVLLFSCCLRRAEYMRWQAEAAESQKAVKTEQSRGIGSILNSRAESTSGKVITKEVNPQAV